MTTAYIVPKLCDTCRSVDFEQFMPRASLQLSNATGEGKDGEYDVDVVSKFITQSDPRVQQYIRNADGTLRLPPWRPHLNDLGPLTDIVSRAGTCPLCNFIAARFKKMVGENYHIHIQDSKLGFVENDPSDLSPYAFNDKRRLWELSGIDFYCVIQSSTGLNRPRFVVPAFLASSSLVNLTRKPTLLARYRPELCDVSLFKSWLQLCTRSHPSCSRPANLGTYAFRLIDVRSMCLVSLRGREKTNARYFALSYVWGGGPKEFVLTKANKQNYGRRQGLPKLPKTISDAILLTSKMGERFLWVDSLCIISDDPQDKAAQIPAMTTIYGRALLTIIAAAGKDANNGLPGIRIPRSKTRAVDLGHCRLMRSCHPSNKNVSDPTRTTTWATRAWTYQELLLSPRSLTFLDQEVIWICKCTKWTEQFDFEHPDMNFHWFNEIDRNHTSLTTENYPMLVENYTQRQLTFESDIVDAFRGIMHAIPEEVYWGIPLSKFGDWLLWELFDKGHGHMQRDCELINVPSWSWFAWKGCIDLCFTRTLLTVYRFQNGQLQQICHGDCFSSSRLPTNMYDDGKDWSVELDDIPAGVALSGNHLVFWALVWEVRNGLETYEWVRAGVTPQFHEYAIKITWHKGVAQRI
jgi:hypothetical protein